MPYRVHHLNAATFCPGPERMVTGTGSLLKKGFLSCHCLLIESNDGLILIDTGFALQDLLQRNTKERVGHLLQGLNIEPDLCLSRQIEALGFRNEDVRHIILTHLDPDHGGGIKDFPHATIHVHRKEFDAAMQPLTMMEKSRYQAVHWQHNPQWCLHEEQGEQWEGFAAVKNLASGLQDILLVPLSGHSRGHCGVAVPTKGGWLLHCGDAYFNHQEIKAEPAYCPPSASLAQALFETSRADRLANQQRLRQLYQDKGEQVELICSHDMNEFRACCQRVGIGV